MLRIGDRRSNANTQWEITQYNALGYEVQWNRNVNRVN
jgi:hypothetical protein